MSDLSELQAMFEHAATQGAQEAGHAAILAGATHLDHPVRSFLSAESVDAQLEGQLAAQVTASSDGDMPPHLPSTTSTADAMAQAAAEEGARQVFG